MKLLVPFAFAALVSLMSSSPSIAQGTVASDHPLLGQWQWTRKRNQCTEMYDFRSDGTVPILSGTERTENVYTVGPNPGESGLYRLTLRTTHYYEGKDCSDSGGGQANYNEITLFVAFERPDLIVFCYEPSTKRCYGPFRRPTPK